MREPGADDMAEHYSSRIRTVELESGAVEYGPRTPDARVEGDYHAAGSSVGRPIDSEGAGGIEGPRVECAGPLLGGELGQHRECVPGNAMISKPSAETSRLAEPLEHAGELLGRRHLIV